MEFSTHGPPAEYSDIFDSQSNGSAATSLVFKRRSSDTLMEAHGHNGAQDWSDYMASYPPAKRLHSHAAHAAAPPESRLAFASAQPTIFDYSTSGAAAAAQSESSFSNLMEKVKKIKRCLNFPEINAYKKIF